MKCQALENNRNHVKKIMIIFNRSNKICEQFFLATLIIFTFSVMGMWSLACEYIMYQKNDFFDNFIFGFLSWILNVYACAFVILISWLTLICSGVLDKDDRLIKVKKLTICQVFSCMFSLLILTCMYFTYFYVEKSNFKANPFDSDAYKYVTCGFLKTFPSFCALIYLLCQEEKSDDVYV